MKYLSTKFEEYINECEKVNLHKDKNNVFNSLSKHLNKHNNLILYGPDGVGKYTQALNYIKNFSPTKLKYERKINLSLNKKNYIFKVSDIHFEIDMELLGCNAKQLFNEYYYHITDILISRGPNTNGIILCKNFNKIHSELLDIFYSYMQTLTHKNINIVYILLSNSVCFIPDNIIERCEIISFKRPTKKRYELISSKSMMKNIKSNEITNIKDILSEINITSISNTRLIKNIVEDIINYKKINYVTMRENIYNLLVFNLDIHDCVYNIVTKLVEKKKIKSENLERIFFSLYKFLKLYNNNYRPIYHLESFIFNLCIVIHGL